MATMAENRENWRVDCSRQVKEEKQKKSILVERNRNPLVSE